ncbi:uncharacterized protein [Rutidosis leptorrhynchoides]|uniref:uncharacterized protein n=1 Tax=Rutidosis leptorrhynchoides TaxID=125765 RepID=UPI003A99F8CB
MGQPNMSYTDPMPEVDPQVHYHHTEHGTVSYGGPTSSWQPYNTSTTILPPRTNFDPFYPPENHGHLPYLTTQYNSEHCNTYMISSPSGGNFSVPVNNHLVHGGQSVQAVPNPWLEQLTWNYCHGVPFVQGGIDVPNMGLHGSQIPTMSRNSMPLMHPRPIRPPHGSHNVYHPPPPPPLPPVHLQNMDIHLPSTSTSHRNHTGTLNPNPIQNAAINSALSSLPIPPPPPGIRDYEAYYRAQTIGFTLWHHGFGHHMRVLPQEELLALSEQIGSVDSGLTDDFISDHLRIRTFFNLEDVDLAVEEPNLCVICQMEFEDQEKIGMLDCWHEYHEECIKKWLTVKNNCPICKSIALT